VVQNLFGAGQNPLDQTIRINKALSKNKCCKYGCEAIS
jgi:hypothetical protein